MVGFPRWLGYYIGMEFSPLPVMPSYRRSSRKALGRWAAFIVTLCAAINFPGQLRAQTVLLNPIADTTRNFTYGNLSFAISACNFTLMGASTSCSSDSIEMETVSTGRGGTEIEIVSPTGSYAQSAGAPITSLSFKMTISDLTGSRGLSSVTNILSATVNNSADNLLVSSVLSGFNVATSPGSAISNLGTFTTSASFALTPSPVSFNVAIEMDTSGARSGDVLTFNNVKLLFQPAPEPASIAVFLTGLGGLAAVRRRFVSRSGGKASTKP
jgi:hypothetical protein